MKITFKTPQPARPIEPYPHARTDAEVYARTYGNQTRRIG